MLEQNKKIQPIKTLENGKLEIFEIYSDKLKKNIQVSLTDPRDSTLLSDMGIVMIGPP